MSTLTAGTHAHEHPHGDAHAHGHAGSFLTTYVFSSDHKVIGIQFLFSTLALVLGRRTAGPGRSLAGGLALEPRCR